MLDSIQSLLDAFPEGVVQAEEGQVLAANAAARQYLPQLIPGDPLPECFPLPGEDGVGKGVFVSGGRVYAFSCTSGGAGQVFLFRPDNRSGLEGWQLEGVLRQLRTLLGELVAEVGPASASGERVSGGAFSKTFHRLFRLTENLEFMRQAAEGGVPFRPVTMDLAGLCRDTVRPAEDLLREGGVQLEYRCKESSMLIPGDPELLRKLLLGLISNAARAAREVTLTLRRSGGWAVLLVSNGGPAPSPRQLAALLQEGPGDALPLPGQGAGLGLPIARYIVGLHGGRLLLQGGGRAPSVLIALPTGPLDGRASVRTPTLYQWDGGLDPVLMELSDILPVSLFGMEGLD